MGHRANFVFIKEGKAKAFYDQWAALGCIHAFAGGPDEALSITAGAEETDGLLDWAFAEGGYLLDFDEQRAIVFGTAETDFDPEDFEDADPDDIPEMSELDAAIQEGSEAFLKAIAPRWPGWLLRWDDRGVDAFAEHLTRRGIQGISCEPASHPKDVASYEHQA
jgi:hypothetical protein